MMPTEENPSEPKVQANDNSTAIGSFNVGGNVRGNVVIGGNHTHIHGPTDNNKPFQHFEPETILIPAGSFQMGTKPEEIKLLIEKFGGDEGNYANETPQHEVSLPDYRIGKYPVTNIQYEEFTSQTNIPISPVIGWDGRRTPHGLEDYPVSGVTWLESVAYCRWLSEKTGRSYSLPNEAQWEKACRAGKQSLFPWGDEFDVNRCNHGRSGLSPVYAYKSQNEWDCFDFVGNLLQWTSTLWGKKLFPPDSQYRYPWKDDGRNSITGNLEIRRAVRGSSMVQEIRFHRCSHRSGQLPSDRGIRTARHGFRVAINLD